MIHLKIEEMKNADCIIIYEGHFNPGGKYIWNNVISN